MTGASVAVLRGFTGLEDGPPGLRQTQRLQDLHPNRAL
jgi:hypothetical protein